MLNTRQWYRFDDDKCAGRVHAVWLLLNLRFARRVSHSSLDVALKSSAYMVFYVKRHLDYKPFSQPTYKVTRESEANREKEKERVKEAARMKEVEDALLATV